MSTAIANTRSNIGIRTIGAYRVSDVYRGPAEPRPRSADTTARRLSGMGTAAMAAESGLPVSEIIRVQAPVVMAANPPALNPDGTASQSGGNTLISQNSPLNVQAIATPTNAQPIPSSMATIQPANAPGYLTITTGGGTVANAAPDYVAEIEDWLTKQTLIPGVPNWGIALGAAALLFFISSKGKR